MTTEKQRCSVCLALIGVYVPKGGDGSAVFIRVHNRVSQEQPFRNERCPGSKQEPKKEP